MKKGIKMVGVLSIALAITFVFSANSFAQFTCGKMEPQTINASSVWLKNVTGAACGTLPANSSRYFLLDPTNTDPMLAILLTALSLGKNVWVASPADTGNGDTATVVAISK